MQDPNEDTEWNDVLRAKGIIPDKPKEKEVSEDDIVSMLEKTIKEKTGGRWFCGFKLINVNPKKYLQNYKITLKTKVSFLFLAKEMEDMTLDELDELEDEEEEKILEQYRQQRIAQIKSLQQKSR